MSVKTMHATCSALIGLQDKDVHIHDDVFMQERGREGGKEREKHASLSGSSATAAFSTSSSGSMRASFLYICIVKIRVLLDQFFKHCTYLHHLHSIFSKSFIRCRLNFMMTIYPT